MLTKYDLQCSEEIITSPQTASCPDVKYFRVVLDQFLTNDIIGLCAVARILDVMIDSERCLSQKAKFRGGSL